ncbi:hypothetical protein H6G96_02450 [Nostoc sp. FACHB-892]|uniref:hypothetical protein n=1 Tax=Nostoc sp. FACHB-892 TaxID=2692843 RepID=UPI0016898D37|nr:hypothetical protein [Nostoc sp. FACHB-892]MBD2725215.1 hypothetical protein [Nostoc sp. FACHB-892]
MHLQSKKRSHNLRHWKCDRSLHPLCSLRLCGLLKRAITKSPKCDRSGNIIKAAV